MARAISPAGLRLTKHSRNPTLENLKKQLEDGGGLVNSGKIRIFDHGLQYKSTPQTMVDMSLVQQEQWILQQVCRTLSVPPAGGIRPFQRHLFK